MAIVLPIIFTIYGCSGSQTYSPVLPNPDGIQAAAKTEGSTHTNWGLWQFYCDPESKTLDVVKLRTGAFHLNALKFVDTPTGVYLTISNLKITGNKVEADIGLRHPFLGLVQFTGFDAKGILISNGSINGFSDNELKIPGTEDTRILNPDGLTRWWNPSEFPDNGTMFGYMDGVLGAANDIGGYTATLNGYKYFCDDLTDLDAPLSDIDPEGRGQFSSGQENVRHYIIDISDDGLVFNYAVDASWKYPVGDPPWDVPGDFPPEANEPEAYRIEVNETKNSLYYTPDQGSGGDLSLSISVYDWYGAELNTVSAEWPGFSDSASSPGPSGGGNGYSTYVVDLEDCTPTAAGEQSILITAACEKAGYQNILPDRVQSAYFIYTALVSDEPPPQGYILKFSDEGILEEMVPEWDDISPALCIETDGDIEMAYNTNKVIANDEARSYACKSTDGLNWTSFQTSFFSWGGVLANHGDCTKIVADKTGNSWRTLALYYVAADKFYTPFTAACQLFPPPIGIDGAHVTTYFNRAPEIIQDADGYVYVMGDGETVPFSTGDHVLQFKKSEVPGSLTGGPSGAIWSNFPKYYIGTGYFSRARSIELAPNGTMYFVYYVDDDANLIRLAYNTDSTGLTWDTSTVVYDGTSTIYTGAHDPGLDITPGGEFHVTFIRKDLAAGTDQLCYVHSTDGASWSQPVKIAEMPEAMNDDPICFFVFDSLDFLATVWKAGTHIYVSFSYDGGETWADAAQVDSLLPENAQPDFVVTSDGVMHIAWAAKNGTHYDIHYRNAWLEKY